VATLGLNSHGQRCLMGEFALRPLKGRPRPLWKVAGQRTFEAGDPGRETAIISRDSGSGENLTAKSGGD
jgi:hypothetical protein